MKAHSLSELIYDRIWLMAGLTLLTVAVSPAQSPPPGLEVRRASDGRLLITPTGDVSRAVLEQANSVGPGARWIPAQVTGDGAFDETARMRVFRLRIEPVPPPPTSGGRLGVLAFDQAPPQVRAGETVRFVVAGEALTLVEPRWFVNGTEGGTIGDGIITVLGRYTAPHSPTNRTVEIRAEVTAANGDFAVAQTFVEILPPLPPRVSVLIPAATGGTLESENARATIQVPPNALAQDTTLQVIAAGPEELEAINADEGPAFDVLARVELLPDGATFSPPATVRVTLDRHVDPGTVLPLEIESGTPGVWEPSGVSGAVAADGVTLVFSTPHFSIWRVVLPRQVLPITPVITEVLPASISEGELRPVLLRGSGFSRSLRVTAHLSGSLLPALQLQVRQTAYDPAAPGDFGVLLKSLPDPSLADGQSRNYTLRIKPNVGPVATVNITVNGLDEFVLANGASRDIPSPRMNRALFSRISIGTGANLDVQGNSLLWQATDEVQILGEVKSRGPDGISADGSEGGGVFPPHPPSLGIRPTDPAPFGAGMGGSVPDNDLSPVATSATAGSPVLSIDFNMYLPGTLNRMYGQPGAMGYDFGPLLGPVFYDASLSPVSEGMYGFYNAELADRLPDRDPFDFDFWHDLADEMTELHPEGRKGQQGVPGGFTPRTGPRGFPSQRRIEAGGGGGGGGASFRRVLRPKFIHNRIGLGGGSGGGGGGAISFAAGAELILGSAAKLDTRGGVGGAGGNFDLDESVTIFPTGPVYGPLTVSEQQDPELDLAGHGGGGGPGGAGTIHLLGGERLTRASGSSPFLNSAGAWGRGGFLMVANTHRQARPPTWMEPASDEVPANSTAEVSGPDFSSTLRTGIQTVRLVDAAALNPFTQGSEVTVRNSAGVRTFRLRGSSSNNRRVRLLLGTGTNLVQISSLADHAVLNRHILVLNTPDCDGDGLSDAEEVALGLDPCVADSNMNGIPDAEETVAASGGTPGGENDDDGDGFPSDIEVAFNSDPGDPGSTPITANLGILPGMIRAVPHELRAVRPAFGVARGVPPAMIVADPRDVRAVRPAIGTAQGVPLDLIIGRPQSLEVQRP